jgi:AcrR family transcriptional regulator
VVTEALTVIAEEGVGALTMRTLATRLGVVPGALYRHVRNKERLQDLVLDGVLAEVDCNLDGSLPWSEQLTVLAHRLRGVLEGHPGLAGLLQLRDRWGRTRWPWLRRSWRRCRPPGSPTARPAWPSSWSSTTPPASRPAARPSPTNEQRVRDQATRGQLHEFFRSLPADRFPVLAALGSHVWVDNRDERFTKGLDMLIDGSGNSHWPSRRRR